MKLGGDEPGKVRHVHHENGADLVGNGAESGKVQMARIRGVARDDYFGSVFERKSAHLVHVHSFGVAAHAVMDEFINFSRSVHRRTVGQVPAVRQVHREDGVAGRGEGQISRLVGLRTGVGLDVGVFGAEQFFGAAHRKRFNLVDHLVAAVIPAPRITFRIFVG